MSAEVDRLGEWIAAANREWHWSRRTIAERTGVGERTIWAIENGKRDTLHDETIDGISRGYGIDKATINRIMRGDNVPVPDDPPAEASTAPTVPSADGFEIDRIWDELTDLRRRLVEQDERMKVRIGDLSDRIERLVSQVGR